LNHNAKNNRAQALLSDTIMPVITKTRGKLALQHVLINILEDKEDDGSPGHIERSMQKNGITGILDLNTISGDDIDNLQYNFTKGK
jgi:hypothetical protein